MGIPGLTSVTFRALSARRVVELAARAGLRAIEWGGDVHVPPGDLAAARRALSLSEESGLSVSSYGSYYRLGQPMDVLKQNLETAGALGAPLVRVWAGTAGSEGMDPRERDRLVEHLMRAAEVAAGFCIKLGLEYHGNTLTDRRESVRALIRETQSEADRLRFYWQPRWDWPEEERLNSLDDVRVRLAHIHAFTWSHRGEAIDRLPLAAGETMWRRVLPSLPEDQVVLLEFVREDAEEAFLRDAAELRRLLSASQEV